MRKHIGYVVGLFMSVLFLDIGLTLLNVPRPESYREYAIHFAGLVSIMAATSIGKLFTDIIRAE